MHEPTPVLSLSHLQRFQPSLAWFARDGSGVHGVAHEARVLIWTQVLAAWLEAEGDGGEAPAGGLANVLGWAAAVHDTQRFDDGIDPEHGERAAEWLLGVGGCGRCGGWGSGAMW